MALLVDSKLYVLKVKIDFFCMHGCEIEVEMRFGFKLLFITNLRMFQIYLRKWDESF